MRKTLQKLCAFTALFVLGTMSSWAQTAFSGSATIKYNEGYATEQVTFKLTEMAAAFGTDTTTLIPELEKFLNKDATTSITYQLVYNGGQSTYNGITDATANGGGGFWMTQDGDCSAYPGIWFTELNYNVANDAFIFNCGHMPGELSEGGTCKANFAMNYNGKYINFEISLEVLPEVVITPTEDMKYSSLNIVKTINHIVSQPQTKSNKVLADTIVVEGLADLLGIESKDDFAADFDKYLFVRHYDVDADPYMKDSIKSEFSGDNSNGYLWSKRTNNETEQVLLDSCYSGALDAEAVTVFRTQDITYSNDTIFMNVGQYSGNAEEDHTYTGTILICNNEGKAVELNVNLAVTKSEALPFNQMNCVGTYTSKTTIIPGNSAAITVTIPDDVVAAIEEKTGVVNGDAIFYAYSDSTYTDITDNSTANNGGFWFGTNGIQTKYDDGAMYVEPVTYANYASFNVGQYVKTLIADGDSTTAALLVVGDNNYYVLNFCLKVKSNVGERENWHIVATQEYDVYLVPSQNFAQNEEDGSTYIIRLDSTSIYNNLGVTSIGAQDLYTWKTNGYSETWNADSLTNAYTCTPNPGFWMSKDGMTSKSWSSDLSFGMNLATDTLAIQWYVYSNVDNINTDSIYNPEYFLVNSENGNVVKIICHIKFVSDPSQRIPQVLPAEEIGSEVVNLIMSEEAISQNYDDVYEYDFDLTKALNALGITVDDLASAEWQVKKNKAGSLTVCEEFAEGANSCPFDSTGVYTTIPEDATFDLGLETDPEVKLYLGYYGNVTEDTGYSTKVALVYDGKAYVFNIVIAGSEEKATGISNVNGEKENTVKGIYTLAGQRVKSASKGLYIINGKKVLVK